jgi:excisionase family DNA binding protein
MHPLHIADELVAAAAAGGYQRFRRGRFAADLSDQEGIMEASQRFLNVSEAAEFLGVSAASLRKWSDQGIVPVYRTPGGQRRYAPPDLEEFLASMRQPAQSVKAVHRYGRNASSITG